MDKICVIGYPSRLGGADTELDHQIRCWQSLGLQVHLLHTGPLDDNLLAMRMQDRGCVVHEPCDWKACRGMHVISYCNAEFLKNLHIIKEYAKSTTFVNCMCWLFDAEKEAHRRELVDHFLYQTEHQYRKVQDELIAINPKFHGHIVPPYFYRDEFPFIEARGTDRFRFGRISREDLAKFHPAQLWVYETMVSPVLKEGMILGINDEIRRKIGNEPNWIRAYPAGGVSAAEIYRHSDCIIQMAETYENLPRVGFEAMASGCLLIVDNRGGWRELVMHKQTGFLCNDQREFVYYASRAAFEVEERRQMVRNARDWLQANWGLDQAQREWVRFFEAIDR